VVGTDPTYDLAVIKLTDAEGLTPIEFGDSADLNVGDVTVAVGAPLGLSNTVTTGIVSALNRSIEIASSAAPDTGDTENDGSTPDEEQQGESPFFFDFGQGETQAPAGESIKIAVIQTDAAINPGNSGGALVNTSGQLIGINTAIYSRTPGGASLGIGFAIPASTAKQVLEQIMQSGQVTRGWIGVGVQDMTRELSESFKLPEIRGALITEVFRGTPADKAGVKLGDILISVEGRPVTDSSSMLNLVAALNPGKQATLKVVRSQQQTDIKVVIGRRPAQQREQR
jgi:putative serine protease PepD